MDRSRLLILATALSLLASLGSGAVPRQPEAVPGSASERSFPLQAIVRASDSQSGDQFGQSVAVSGSVAIVGSPGEDGGIGDPIPGAGAAYVIQRDRDGASKWGQVQKLTASDAQSDDLLGFSVAISGEYAIVGAPHEDGGIGDPLSDAGAAYIFRRDQGGASNWGQVERLTAPDAEADDWFGCSVAISGDTAIVGARQEDGGPVGLGADAGAAYVFQRISGFGWIHIKTIRPANLEAGDLFGVSVSVSDDVVIVGANLEDGGPGDPLADAGTAYVFGRNEDGANEWGEVAQLVSGDPSPMDWFGTSVAISGNLAVIGAHGEDGGSGDPTLNAGAAYVFQNKPGVGWTQVKKLQATGPEIDDRLGWSVAVSANVVLASAHFKRSISGHPLFTAGAAYAFMRHLGGPNAWGQATRVLAPDAQAGDQFGYSVALFGNNALVGAYYEDGGAGDPLIGAGAAYVFYVSLLEAFKAN